MAEKDFGMKTPPVDVELKGLVRPPQNLDDAARKTLGPRYADFVRQFPNFTPQQLVKFAEQ